MVRLTTSRLILRDFHLQDVCELAPILANPKVMTFSPTGPISVSQTQAKIANFIASYEKYGFGKWAVILRCTRQLIGYCGIAVETIDNQPEYEIGYRLAPNYWNQGLATEAAKKAIAYSFKSLDLPYILGIVEPANLASIKVLAKIGMSYQQQTIFAGTKMNVYIRSR